MCLAAQYKWVGHDRNVTQPNSYQHGWLKANIPWTNMMIYNFSISQLTLPQRSNSLLIGQWAFILAVQWSMICCLWSPPWCAILHKDQNPSQRSNVVSSLPHLDVHSTALFMAWISSPSPSVVQTLSIPRSISLIHPLTVLIENDLMHVAEDETPLHPFVPWAGLQTFHIPPQTPDFPDEFKLCWIHVVALPEC